MVQTLDRLITVAELAVRAARAAKALRSAGNNESAMVLEQECTALCKQIVATQKRRRANARKARSQTRIGGRFA